MIRTVICECKNDTYESTYEFDIKTGLSNPIWICVNCGKRTKRRCYSENGYLKMFRSRRRKK